MTATRILHLSDLHFGRTREELCEPLHEAIRTIAPDVVAISGDFTQRAREEQYKAARDFLDRIDAPVIAVPGNHDISLTNPLMRFFAPYARFRRWITSERTPDYSTDIAHIVGINTATPYRWQSGKIGDRTVRQVCHKLDRSGDERRKIVVLVAHHPFNEGMDARKRVMSGASKAAQSLADCGVNIVLTGHLHRWMTTTFATRDGAQRLLLVHAGTGLSTRERGDPNDFGLLRIDETRVTVDRYQPEGPSLRFAPQERKTYELRNNTWVRDL